VTAGRRRLAAAAAIVVLVVLAAALAVAALHRLSRPSVRLVRAASVERSLSPEDPQFGDTVTATIDVFVDSRRVDLRSVAVKTGFAPYRVVSSKRTTHRQGDVGIVHIEDRLRCLEVACVPPGDRRTFRFAPVQVDYRNGSRSVTLRAPGPELRVHARVTAADTARPVFRVGPPQATRTGYRFPPEPTGYVLLALAALLTVGGAALLVRAGLLGLRLRGRAREAPLERILRELAAASTNGDSGRRRRALEELARELEPVDEPLSAESRVLAWAPDDPNPEWIADLTVRVQSAVKR
jgi:hypothetical protein